MITLKSSLNPIRVSFLNLIGIFGFRNCFELRNSDFGFCSILNFLPGSPVRNLRVFPNPAIYRRGGTRGSVRRLPTTPGPVGRNRTRSLRGRNPDNAG